MHMLHVRDLLAQVFVAKGYHVVEGPYGGLLAKSPGETLLVEWKSDAPATSADVRALSAALGPCGAARAVFVAAAGAPPSVVHEGTRLKIETWTLSRAALEVGFAALESAADGTPPVAAAAPQSAPPAEAPAPSAQPLIVPTRPQSLLATAARLSDNAGTGGAVLLPSKAREIAPSTTKMLPSPWDIASGAARVPSQGYERRSAAAGRSPTVVAREDSDVELVGGAKVKNLPRAVKTLPPFPENAALRARVSRDEAAARATTLGRLQSAKLMLVPHVAFDFDCRVENENLPAPIEAKGTVLAHSGTGTLRELPILEFAEAPTDAERTSARLTAVDVYDKVRGYLLRQTTKEVKVEKDVGGVTVMGTERIGPSAEELGLAHRGVVQVPVWRVVGERGTMEIDAVTGDVLG